MDEITKVINAREKLKKLVEVVDTWVMNDIGDFIDSLTEEESKHILRMLVYGEWKRFNK
jgi:hypothetical protein